MRRLRIACAHIRDFGLQLWLRAHPRARAAPAVLAGTGGATGLVLAANRAARRRGVERGITVAQAQSRCPGLHVEPRSEDVEQAASREVKEQFIRLTPGIEEDTPGCYFLESLGAGRMYRSEHAFARRLIEVAGELKLYACVGLAGSKLVARIAADISRPRTFTIIPQGRESRFLAALPTEHLEISDETRAQMRALGLTTIAQVAALPAADLSARFGLEGTRVARWARGDDPKLFVPGALPEDLSRSQAFSFPLFCAGILTTHVTRLLEELLVELQAGGRAAQRVSVALDLETSRSETLLLATAEPTCAARRFVRQLERKIENLGLRSGVRGVTVRIEATAKPPVEQRALLAAPADRAAEPNATDSSPPVTAVFVPQLVRAVLPEQAFRLDSGATHPPRATLSLPGCVYSSRAITGLRLWHPPRNVEVYCRDGAPVALTRERGRRIIRRHRGPWILSGGWWGDGFDRHYYDIETESGCGYLIFLDRQASRWFLQGVFD